MVEVNKNTEDNNIDKKLNISDVIKRYVVKYRILKPISYGEEIIEATDKWNAYDIFMNSHQYCDVVNINVL
jgi:hypothetical protein